MVLDIKADYQWMAKSKNELVELQGVEIAWLRDQMAMGNPENRGDKVMPEVL